MKYQKEIVDRATNVVLNDGNFEHERVRISLAKKAIKILGVKETPKIVGELSNLTLSYMNTFSHDGWEGINTHAVAEKTREVIKNILKEYVKC